MTADPAPDRDQLRRTFDAEAGLGPGRRVLEVAPGTGQLTVPLAALGCAVTAVELGPALAAVARRNLAPYPRAEVVVCALRLAVSLTAAGSLIGSAASGVRRRMRPARGKRRHLSASKQAGVDLVATQACEVLSDQFGLTAPEDNGVFR